MRLIKQLHNLLLTTALAVIVLVYSTSNSYAEENLISIFPLDNYAQTVSTWIKSSDSNFNKPLLSAEMQQQRFDIFIEHCFGSSSPWSSEYVNTLLQRSPPEDIKSIEQAIIHDFNNQGKPDHQIGYGENFRPHDSEWIEKIAHNINLSQLDGLTYRTENRGIAVDNLHARVLPTEDVHFYSHKLAGQGYPFDNLQMSALWAGTPVYILAETRDRAWMLVVTPDYISWVKSSGIARTDPAFVQKWVKAAKNKLAAITYTQTSLVDDKGKFLLLAYVGSVFPAYGDLESMQIMVPIANSEGHAVIAKAVVSPEKAAFMPMRATPKNFSVLMSTMISRPYGWGSMYFYNDCSAELKSLLAPFGIWLPRHSSDQVTAGKMVDMTTASQEKRLAYLMENGQPFLTIIYIGGHVVLYIGNYADPNDENSSLMAMTYQNVWGLSPDPAIRRAVIGRSVLFPMLLKYPEDNSLKSLAGKKYFQISYLNQLPDANLWMKKKGIDLRYLMYTELFLNHT